MAGQKRAKEVARAKHHRQHARRTAKQKARRRNGWIAGGVVGLIIVLGVAFALWPESSQDPSPAASSSSSKPPAPVEAPENVSCTDATPQAATGQYSKPDAMKLTAGSAMTLDTNCGAITFGLNVAGAPKSTNALAFLASKGWYNNGNCPRLTVEGLYVIQCGAGKPNGQGDPGFTIPDENLPTAGSGGSALYPRGTVAMANRGPNTSSSQFFLVYKDTMLGPNYSIVGQVTSGLDVIEYVAAQGVSDSSTNQADGTPAQPLVIKTATVRNGP
ncbi:MAG: peptidylprolyl isomerase [Candidatus Nanopelagicales bacterium]